MRWLWLSLGVLLAGCEPRAAVTVVRDGAGYEVHFENCARPGQTLPVKRVEVHRKSAPAGEPVDCVLERTGTGQLADSWRYGDPVPGYELKGCAPLQPGETYRIHVSLGPVVAETVVTVAPDGSLPSVKGCK